MKEMGDVLFSYNGRFETLKQNALWKYKPPRVDEI